MKHGVTMYLKKASVAQTGTFGSGAKVPASARPPPSARATSSTWCSARWT